VNVFFFFLPFSCFGRKIFIPFLLNIKRVVESMSYNKKKKYIQIANFTIELSDDPEYMKAVEDLISLVEIESLRTLLRRKDSELNK